MKVAAYALALVLILGGSIAFRAYSPCWMWGLAKASDVPARCVMNR